MSDLSDFVIENGVLKEYTGPGGDVVIPMGVTEIGGSVFDNCPGIKSVAFPDGIKTIGQAAFRNCEGLDSITIPESVESIGTLAFANCGKLKKVSFRGNTPIIRDRAFMGCTGLQDANGFVIVGGVLWSYHGKDAEVTIPQSVSRIGEFAFSNSSLSSIRIPDNVLSIGWNAFWNCRNLCHISLPASDIRIETGAFHGCDHLLNLTIPEGVKTIGYGAFSWCWRLKTITLPKSVTSIESSIFHGGARLKSMTILASHLELPKKKYGLFNNTPSRDLVVFAPHLSLSVLQEQGMAPAAAKGFFDNPSSYTDAAVVEEYAMYIAANRKKLLPEVMKHDIVDVLRILAEKKKITKKNVNQDYYEPAVEYSAVKCISFLDSLFEAESDSSEADKKKKINHSHDFIVQKGVLTKYTGRGGEVIIPDNVTEIGAGVFRKSKTLTAVTFPDSLKIIGNEAFANCSGLTSVTIPPSVTEIRFGAFDWCENLKDVYIHDLEAWCRIEFGGVYANCGNPLSAGARLHVNGEVLTELVLPEGIEAVGNYVFYHCVSLKSATLPKGITRIGDYAFFECTDMSLLSLSPGVTSIGNGAFCGCAKLTELSLPVGVTSIGDVAFCNCPSLWDVALPESVETLGDQAFGDCGKLNITLPSTLKRPKADMFGRLWRKAPFSGSSCSIWVGKWSALLTKMMEGCQIEEITAANYALVPGEILLPVAVRMAAKKGWDPASDSGKALFSALSKNAGKLSSIAVQDPAWLQLLCDKKLIKVGDLDTYFDEADKQENAEIKAMLLNYRNKLGTREVEKACEKKTKRKDNYADALVERTAARDPSSGIEGMTFVITGALNAWPKVWSSRDEVKRYLKAHGAALGSTLSIKTDYLVTNDTDSGSEKNRKAKELGVPVIDEEEFNRMVCRHFDDEEKVIVPSWVKIIGSAAFSVSDWEGWRYDICYKTLKEVILPDGITSIGEKAFAGAGNLEKINIPDSVTSIGEWAFSKCSSLAEINLPRSLVNIGTRAFDGCRMLKKISVPDGVKSIGIGAFGDCASLDEVRIPASVVNIGIVAFDTAGIGNSGNLTVYAPKGSYAEEYARKNGIAFVAVGDKSVNTEESKDDTVAETKGKDFPNVSDPADFIVENGVLKKYKGPGGYVVIPDGITAVGFSAFENCVGLTEIIIPEGVKTIGWHAFEGCAGLRKVVLPDSLTQIEICAFRGCGSLTDVHIPKGVTKIGGGAFEDCTSLSHLEIPDEVANIEDRAFTGCRGLIDTEGFVIVRNILYSYHGSGDKVTIPRGITEISGLAFYKCAGVTSITLPEGVTGIGDFAFSDCPDLQSVDIPDGVMRIGEYAFCGCSTLTRILIPDSVTNIGEKAFSGCSSLESITIPGGVSVVEEEMFYNCRKLSEVRLSEGVESLGKNVFLFCDGLKDVWLPASLKKRGNNGFSCCTIHAPAKSYAQKYAKSHNIAFEVWETE